MKVDTCSTSGEETCSGRSLHEVTETDDDVYIVEPQKQSLADQRGVRTKVRKLSNDMAFSEATRHKGSPTDIDKIRQEIRKNAAEKICAHIEEIIMKHSASTILRRKNDLDALIADLENYGVDPSIVRGKVEHLMAFASQYNEMKLVINQKPDGDAYNQQLSHLESGISELKEDRQPKRARWKVVADTIDTLMKELAELKDAITTIDQGLFAMENEKIDFKATSELTTDEIEEATRLRDDFRKHRDSFKGLTWM